MAGGRDWTFYTIYCILTIYITEYDWLRVWSGCQAEQEHRPVMPNPVANGKPVSAWDQVSCQGNRK